jgi:methyltransferase-like protein
MNNFCTVTIDFGNDGKKTSQAVIDTMSGKVVIHGDGLWPREIKITQDVMAVLQKYKDNYPKGN